MLIPDNDQGRRSMLLFGILILSFILAQFFLAPPKNEEVVTTTSEDIIAENKIEEKEDTVVENMTPTLDATIKTTPTNDFTFTNEDESVLLKINNGNVTSLILSGAWDFNHEGMQLIGKDQLIAPFTLGIGDVDSTIAGNKVPMHVVDTKENTIFMTGNALVNGKNLSIKRELAVKGDYLFHDTITIKNTSSSSVTLSDNNVAFSVVSLFGYSLDFNSRNILRTYYFDGKKKHKTGLKKKDGDTKVIEDVKWLSVNDNFFLSILEPVEDKPMTAYFRSTMSDANGQRILFAYEAPALTLNANESVSVTLQQYIGPKKEGIVKQINSEYKQIFKWPVVFNWILKPIEIATSFLISKLSKVMNPGIVVMLIALLVKLILSPLSIKSAISIKRMNLLQPKLKKLQEKYRHNDQLLQKKTLELYKQEKINPLGGCLPLLLQIPVFFVLYRVLSSAIELKGVSFLWISDLTRPDVLFHLGGFEIHLLPLLMVTVQIFSMKLQQQRSAGGADQQQMQKMNMYILPFVFLFLFWNMPAGLVLYWTVQNLFTIVEQKIVNYDKNVKL